jgi:hypothetical protein
VEGKATSRTSLYVSRLDGSNMRSVGFVDAPLAAGSLLYEPRWSPDDKQLSFHYEGAFWTVPVNIQ